MLDIKYLRNNLSAVAAKLAIKGFVLDSEQFSALDIKHRELLAQAQKLQQQRNASSKSIGMAKARGEDIAPLLKNVADVGAALTELEQQVTVAATQLQDFLLQIPNIPASSVPVGKDESCNIVMRHWGSVPEFSFKAKEHWELSFTAGELDFKTAAKLSGSRFVLLRGAICRLHRALAQFMLDLHVDKHGYQEVYTPYIVHSENLRGTGQLPKFAADSFKIAASDFWLIPTAEVPVTNQVRDTIIAANDLPLKYVCHSPCFRSEAGSYGKDTKGMLRQHQFDKVELVQVVQAENSAAALEELTTAAETVLQQLKLPYRVMNLCGGDLGFAAAQTYDLEVWLPGQGCYREISSCSSATDFQARRMQARVRGEKMQLAHTLNGSGVAVGRALIAVLENYQDARGSVVIPEVLLPYMGGLEIIS